MKFKHSACHFTGADARAEAQIQKYPYWANITQYVVTDLGWVLVRHDEGFEAEGVDLSGWKCVGQMLPSDKPHFLPVKCMG